jgi:hypothetical protein
MSVIDDAIVKIQTHALAITAEEVRSAPSKPVESANVLPLAITYIAEGTAQANDVTTCQLLYTINTDFHVRRDIMKAAYTQLDNIIPEFCQRLAGDPTLGGTVDTIVFPISFSVGPAQWDAVVTQMASFSIPIKILTTPTT